MKNFLLNFSILIFLFIIHIISFFFNIKLGRVYTSRIGHLSLNLDNYLSSQQEIKNPGIVLFGVDKVIANNYLLDLFKRKKNIFFHRYFFYCYEFLRYYRPSSKMLIKYEEMHPELNLFSNTYKNIIMSNKDISKGNDLLKKLKIQKPFVCIHNRDTFYDNQITNDKNFHDYRNYEISTAIKAINFFLSKNLNVTRIGKKAKEFKIVDKKYYHSLINDKHDPFLDIFLISQSLFAISCTSGICDLARLFRKPTLILNKFPLTIKDLAGRSNGSIYVPKKIFNNKEKRYLKISECFNLNYDIHYEGKFTEDKNLKIIDNTEEEIFLSAQEMYKKINNEFFLDNKKKALKEKFLISMKKINNYDYLTQNLNIDISLSYLEKNEHLI